jgi:hypothetical protein
MRRSSGMPAGCAAAVACQLDAPQQWYATTAPLLTFWGSPAAGLPPENDVTHCPENGTSCYFMYPVARNYRDATARCARNRGGYLVSWNTGGAAEGLVMCGKAANEVVGDMQEGMPDGSAWLMAHTVYTTLHKAPSLAHMPRCCCRG